MLEKLRLKLERIEKEIKTYKNNVIEEIEREEMVAASSDLLIMRDLKEQQLLIKKIITTLQIEKSEEWKNE